MRERERERERGGAHCIQATLEDQLLLSGKFVPH